MSGTLRLGRHLVVPCLFMLMLIGVVRNLRIGDKLVISSSPDVENDETLAFAWQPQSIGSTTRKSLARSDSRVDDPDPNVLKQADVEMHWLSSLQLELQSQAEDKKETNVAIAITKPNADRKSNDSRGYEGALSWLSQLQLEPHPHIEDKDEIETARRIKVAEGKRVEGALTFLSSFQEPTKQPLPANGTIDEKCCRVAWDGSEEERAVPSCLDTCFTKRACNDPAYPFSSMEEKEMFASWKPSEHATQTLKKDCYRFMTSNNKANSLSTPHWCQHDKHAEERVTSMNLTNVPSGCSRFSMAQFSGPFDRTFIFPSLPSKDDTKTQLAFCAIPKVGMTQWLQFLRYTIGAVDYQAAPHWKDDIMRYLRFDRMRPEMRSSILTDPSGQWTKAVFLRDPAERLLSSYLDKIHKEGSGSTFEGFVRGLAKKNIDCAVDGYKKKPKISKEGLTWCSDPHWRPQVWSCGLWELLPHFAFVGAIDSADTATKALLEKVGLWGPYGKHYRTGISGPGQMVCELLPPAPLAPGEEPVGFQQRALRKGQNSSQSDHGNMYGHSKHSKTKLQQYYTNELLAIVKKLYAADYLLWNALKEHGKDGWATGQELSRILNPKCK